MLSIPSLLLLALSTLSVLPTQTAASFSASGFTFSGTANPASNDVQITIQSSSLQPGRWVGLGINDQPDMAGADMFLVLVGTDGAVRLMEYSGRSGGLNAPVGAAASLGASAFNNGDLSVTFRLPATLPSGRSVANAPAYLWGTGPLSGSTPLRHSDRGFGSNLVSAVAPPPPPPPPPAPSTSTAAPAPASSSSAAAPSPSTATASTTARSATATATLPVTVGASVTASANVVPTTTSVVVGTTTASKPSRAGKGAVASSMGAVMVAALVAVFAF
ncbi:hypothetical protein HDU67_007323 [Dinochytrium kinnereticum]|nr:hypothetical protein HDU67_007323 [Dinochytrium kinnereticum]